MANRVGPARRAWSRHEERRDTVRCGLRVLDERFHVHAYQIAVLLEQAARDEHVLDILGLAVVMSWLTGATWGAKLSVRGR